MHGACNNSFFRIKNNDIGARTEDVHGAFFPGFADRREPIRNLGGFLKISRLSRAGTVVKIDIPINNKSKKERDSYHHQGVNI